MRGYQKRVIFLKHTGSRLFDEAYFVVSPSSEGAAEGDMVLEANRIIEDNIKSEGSDIKRASKKFWVPFLAGAVISAFIFSAVLFLISL